MVISQIEVQLVVYSTTRSKKSDSKNKTLQQTPTRNKKNRIKIIN